jgi:sugar lactone lactonase YvrE/enterochelin esterase-like enzyme
MVHRFLFLTLLAVLPTVALAAPEPMAPQISVIEPPTPVPPLVDKIRKELDGPPLPDAQRQPGVPQGEMLSGEITDSKIYPGTENQFQVYVPKQYNPDKPACLLVKLDGFAGGQAIILDNLIAKGDMPVTIGVGITPGMIVKPGDDAQAAAAETEAKPGKPVKPPKKDVARFNRSYEFDSVNDNLPNYVLDELLPKVEAMTTKDGRAIHLSHDPNDRAVTGGSTGGIGSFTLAWRRPDAFSRVYTLIGTYVSMRGGHEYPALIRKTEPKPIRIFLEDGNIDSWNQIFGSWFMANVQMEAALNWSGYDVQHAWGTHAHNGKPGGTIFPDVMRWLWAGWPAKIQAGTSRNDQLVAMLVPGQTWQLVGDGYKAATGLASNPQGEVCFSDAPDQTIYKIGADGKPAAFAQRTPAVSGEAFGPDGTLYVTAPADQKICTIDSTGMTKDIATGIRGHGIVVTSDKSIYVTEPGEHTDMPSQLWLIKPTGEKSVIDSGLSAASGLAFSPDKALLFGAEEATKWVYSYIMQPDGTLADKQRFYWLHMTDIPNNSGAEDMAVDTDGSLYVATRMGIQVCDRNGRVRAILPLPTPCGPVQSLCWGGPAFDTLYATDGNKVFARKMKIPGYSQWAAPAVLKPGSGG